MNASEFMADWTIERMSGPELLDLQARGFPLPPHLAVKAQATRDRAAAIAETGDIQRQGPTPRERRLMEARTAGKGT